MRSTSKQAGLPHAFRPARRRLAASSRVSPAGALKAAVTSGSRSPAIAPGADMTDVIDSTLPGCSSAMAWTIMPPIDQPAMWATSAPIASSTAKPSLAMSSTV